MVDISQFAAPKTDQLNADDLIAGPRTIRIREVRAMGSAEQPLAIYFDGDDGKPYKPGKSMMRALMFAWGPEGDEYVGRSMTLYRDPTVMFGDVAMGGIRISHMSDIPHTLEFPLTARRGKRTLYKVEKLVEQRRKSLDDHVASYAAALGRAEDMSALLELVAGEGAARIKGAVDKAGRDDLKQRMADAESARRAALEEAFDDGEADDAADDIASATERELDDDDPFGENAD